MKKESNNYGRILFNTRKKKDFYLSGKTNKYRYSNKRYKIC